MSSLASCAPAVHAGALCPAAWQALSYVANKRATRDALVDGDAHSVHLQISGEVDGVPLEPVSIDGRLTIGHASTSSSSSIPNFGQVLGWILGKLNESTRTAILRDLPAEFAARGCTLPDVPVGLVAQADALLASLKRTKPCHVRGAVRCDYHLSTEPALGIVG